jgi:hypothetical protein
LRAPQHVSSTNRLLRYDASAAATHGRGRDRLERHTADVADRFAQAIAAIDAANAQDPNVLLDGGGDARPKELLHAELVTAWVRRLRPEAGEPLLLAARGHHFRRWTVPRNTYPTGRVGYLRWRRDLHQQHAAELGALLAGCGYDAATIERVATIVRKDELKAGDADTQALEDAMCLVFLETQFADIAARLDDAKMIDVLAKTAQKMSPQALAFAADLPLDEAGRDLLQRALAP